MLAPPFFFFFKLLIPNQSKLRCCPCPCQPSSPAPSVHPGILISKCAFKHCSFTCSSGEGHATFSDSDIQDNKGIPKQSLQNESGFKIDIHPRWLSVFSMLASTARCNSASLINVLRPRLQRGLLSTRPCSHPPHTASCQTCSQTRLMWCNKKACTRSIRRYLI